MEQAISDRIKSIVLLWHSLIKNNPAYQIDNPKRIKRINKLINELESEYMMYLASKCIK